MAKKKEERISWPLLPTFPLTAEDEDTFLRLCIQFFQERTDLDLPGHTSAAHIYRALKRYQQEAGKA